MTEKRRTPKVLLFLLNPEGNPTPVDRPFEDPATPEKNFGMMPDIEGHSEDFHYNFFG
ncbi:MAG: hypothetical protein PHI99_09430 [Syntrophales bacterium]|nr:hypothetical protein [Syntrophales bacterium]